MYEKIKIRALIRLIRLRKTIQCIVQYIFCDMAIFDKLCLKCVCNVC